MAAPKKVDTFDDEIENVTSKTPTTPPEGSAGDSGAAPDDTAEKLAQAESDLQVALEERDNARGWSRLALLKFADALGIPEEGEGVDIYDIPDDIVAKAVELIAAGKAADATPAPTTQPKLSTATGLRVTIVEQDAAGKPLRKWGLVTSLGQANPAAVGESVKRTVEEILSVPVGPAEAFQQEPVDE